MNGHDFSSKVILCEIEEGAKMVNTRHSLESYYSLTSNLHIIDFESVLQSSFKLILCQHPPPSIWLSILSWPEAGRLGGQQKSSKYISLVVSVLNPTSCLPRYNKSQILPSQKLFWNPTK